MSAAKMLASVLDAEQDPLLAPSQGRAYDGNVAAGVLASDDEDDSPRKNSWTGHKDFEGLPWWQKPSVFWLLGPFFLFTLAFGGSLVPKLNL